MTHTDNATCRKTLVTTTRHISERTISLLRATDPYDWPYGGGPIGKSGFFYRSMKRNPSSLPTDLFEVLSWAADKGYDSVTFSDDGPVIDQFEVHRESGSYGDALMWAKTPQHLKYQRSLYESALSALSVGDRAFEVSPENVACALTVALETVDQYLAEDEGLWNIPLPSLQRIADVATIYLEERNYKTGWWDDSIAAAAELHRLMNFELERSKNIPLDPQQRLVHSLAEQIRYLLQEPM